MILSYTEIDEKVVTYESTNTAKSGMMENILLKKQDASGFTLKMTPEKFREVDKTLHVKGYNWQYLLIVC